MKFTITYEYDDKAQRGKRFAAFTDLPSDRHISDRRLVAYAADYHAAKSELLEMVRDFRKKPQDEEYELPDE